MVFKSNGNGEIVTNWKTLASIFSILAVLITVFTTVVNIGIGWGSVRGDIGHLKSQITDIRTDIQSIYCEIKDINKTLPVVVTKIDNHEERIRKIEGGNK